MHNYWVSNSHKLVLKYWFYSTSLIPCYSDQCIVEGREYGSKRGRYEEIRFDGNDTMKLNQTPDQAEKANLCAHV